jgi:hypothetical protein
VDDLTLQVGLVDDVEVDAARYSSAGAPSPPAPITSTRAFLSRF